MDNNYETPLSKKEEIEFQNWFIGAKALGVIHPSDNGQDYDFRGFWKNEIKNNTEASKSNNQETHFTDKYKKPNHPTFSNESIYAKGKMKDYAGKWTKNNVFIPPKKKYTEMREGMISRYGLQIPL